MIQVYNPNTSSHHQLHVDSCFTCVPVLAGHSGFSSSNCARTEPFGDKWHRFLRERCPFCQPTNSVI